MAYIETTPPATATGDVRAIYERNQAKFGYVPNYVKLFSHRPQVLMQWGPFLGSIRDPMDLRRYELVTLAAARALRSSYCALAHGTVLRRQFYPADRLQAIAHDYTAAELTPAEVAMMRFAELVVRDAAAVTRDDVQVLRDHGFGDTEIFDIAATASVRCFFSKLSDALGAEPDATFAQLEEGLRTELVVGRPISEAAVEQVPAAG